MNAERLKQIEEIYHAVSELALDEREAFLAQACDVDEELRGEVESLLSFEKNSNSILEMSPKSFVAEMFSEQEKQTLIGSRISQYKILSLLGEGGMGAVYLAQDIKLLRPVALKIFPAEKVGDTNRVQRFIHEARAASALNHPHILTIYDVGQERDIHFIAMEFVDGHTLHDLIYRQNPDLKSLLKYLVQAAEGLSKAHSAGIVHRDLKPENIMVSQDGYAKILDFGLAKLIEPNSELRQAQQHQSLQGIILGTPGYMSPEQIHDQTEIDSRSDVFSFGCILYEAVARRKPFNGSSTFDVLNHIINTEPEPFKTSSELYEIISKCLKKSPSARFQTIKEVSDLLKRIDAENLEMPFAENEPVNFETLKIPRAFSRPSSEQRRQSTVLFADLAKFSEMLEELEPEESGEIINDLFLALNEAIEKGKGKIERRLNDIFVAVWGSGAISEDDPENAIRTALDLQKTVQEFALQAQLPNALSPENSHLFLKIGISTGTVLLGKSSGTGEFLISGSAFNTAKRLQQKASGGEILISHETYRHVRGVFDLTEFSSANTGGGESKIYSVKRAKSRAFRLGRRGVEGIETELVGRKNEIGKMLDGLQTVFEDGELQIFTITGEAGLGKSRLLFEFRNQIGLREEKVRVFNAAGIETMFGSPYSLVRDLFSFRFEIQDDDSAQITREKFVKGFLNLWKENASLDEETEMKIHFIGQLIGFNFSDSPYLKGVLSDLKQIHIRALHYAAQFFAVIAQKIPVVIYLDDLHWADSESLDFFDYLARNCLASPILILEFSRPALFESRPHWGEGQANRTRFDLSPLTKRESRQLVGDILQKISGGGAAPQNLRDLIVSHAEGNPFYIEELIKMLIDRGAIVVRTDEWFLDESRLKATEVPTTLTGVLQARLDKLTVWEKRILQRASVIGREFWDKAIEDFSEEINVGPILETLRQKELLFRNENSIFADTAQYLFKHAILRDVTYETVLLNERRSWHQKTAEWLIRESGERAGEYAATIAGHFEEAKEIDRSTKWFGRAGEQSLKTNAPETAIFYLQKALRFAAEEKTNVSLNDIANWQSSLSKSFWYQANYNEALKHIKKTLESAGELEDKLLQAEAYAFLSILQFETGDLRASLESAFESVRCAREAGESDEAKIRLVYALFRQSRSCSDLGKFAEGIALGEEGVQIAEALGDLALLGKGLCYHALQGNYYHQGNYEKADFYTRQELAIMRKLKNVITVANALNSLGESQRMRGNAKEALPYYEEALGTVREMNNKAVEIILLSNMSGALVILGEHQKAEKQLREVVKKMETAGHFLLPEALFFLAQALFYQNNLSEATDAALRSLDLSQKAEYSTGIGYAWRILGMISAKNNQAIIIGAESFNAAQCFENALQIFIKTNIESEKALTLQEFARYKNQCGDAATAATMQHEAREIFTKLKMAY